MSKKYLVGEEIDGDLVVDLGPDYTTSRPPPVPGAIRPEIPLLDSIAWKQRIGNDGMGNIFSSPIIIAADVVFESKLVRTIRGDELQCSALVNCVEAVLPDDILIIDGQSSPVTGIVKVIKDDNRVVQWRTISI